MTTVVPKVTGNMIFATGYQVIDGSPRDEFDKVSSRRAATRLTPVDRFFNRQLIWKASDPCIPDAVVELCGAITRYL